FHPKRVISKRAGIIKYDETFYNSLPTKKLTKIDIEYQSGSSLESVNVESGAIVLLPNNARVTANQWIAGKRLSNHITKRYYFREAFRHSYPTLENTLYLLYYSYCTQNEFLNDEDYTLIDKNIQNINKLYDITVAVDRKNSSTSLGLNNEYVDFLQHIESVQKKINLRIDNLPDDFILEAFRDSIPSNFPKSIRIDTDQALLTVRNSQHTPLFFNPLFSMDRLRRIRNELVHEGSTSIGNIDVLSRFLSKITRFYLKKFFKNSTLLDKFQDKDSVITGIRVKDKVI
ncbi:MAG: hypothetical protein AAGG68_29770, partial [Bacteroidota bacterium]